VFGKPRTSSGEDRAVDLDGYLVGALMDHRLGQAAQRAELGAAYIDHGPANRNHL
jgi:hypothetical protein